MHPTARQFIRNAAKLVEHAPAIADRVETTVKACRRAAGALRSESDDDGDCEDVTVIGALTAVSYGADKGDGLKQYFHDFKGTKPLLCVNAAGDLVIVREGSRYRFDPARGIVG